MLNLTFFVEYQNGSNVSINVCNNRMSKYQIKKAVMDKTTISDDSIYIFIGDILSSYWR